jgi:hypothetical protein
MCKVNVVDEYNTIEKLTQGYSISRFGDGELELVFLSGLAYFKELLRGRRPQVFENGGPWFSYRLRKVLKSNNKKLLIGIPNVFFENSATKWKSEYFQANKRRIPGKTYYSAFFVRYNRRSMLNEEAHWNQIRRIWDGKKISIVHFNPEIAHLDIFSNASKIEHILCKRRNIWGWGYRYKKLLQRCLDEDYELCLAMAGPVANLLAYDLCAKGRQCIDIGQLIRLHAHSKGQTTQKFY